MRRNPAILLFGDSITASYAFVTSPGAAGPGWYNNANALAAQKFGPPINSGAGSDTLTLMLARFDADVTPFDGYVVHVLGGANDLHASRAGSLCVTDLETICDAIVALGRKVLLGTQYPTTTSAASGAITAELLAMNAGIRAYAATEPNVYLVDYSAAMSADGESVDDAGYLIDAVHPGKEGAAIMARTLAPIMAAMP